MEKKNYLSWVEFYSEFATKLLPYQKNRKSLIKIIKKVFSAIEIRLPKLEKDRNIIDIDPFTVFGLFNKGITNANRILIISKFAEEFGIKASVPKTFDGIPLLNNQKATYYQFIDKRDDSDIDNLWGVFTSALEYADSHWNKSEEKFIHYYNAAIKQKGVKWNITMGLYWIRPYTFINLDSRNRWFITNPQNMPEKFISSLNSLNIVPTAEQYLTIISNCTKALKNNKYAYNNFPELSYYAWKISEEVNQGKKSTEDQLNTLFDDDMPEDAKEKEIEYPSYTEQDFLNEVYLDEDKYNTLLTLLKNKKNIILQGAPGVGKTFAAKRLAYSIMGVKDKERVMMLQFHQSYSYEDFIMGFRPSTSGFVLKKGPFYNFCKKAEIDSDNDYFFIIDEINRGNLSKIFGELFMLIENDKRGVELQLLYSEETFSVPENVYIIGMMNTADRSLAMLDYALRRRFAFFELSPAFETEGFVKYKTKINNSKFNQLILVVKQLNGAIEEDDTLGKGFRIGHSYFCAASEINENWLNAVIDYELVPLLNEYWFDEPSKVRDWTNALKGAIK